MGPAGLPIARRCECHQAKVRRSNRIQGLPSKLANLTFDNFTCGDIGVNRGTYPVLSVSANKARIFATTFPAGEHRGLLFHSGPRERLTHLAVATLQRIAERGFSCIYCDCAILMEAMMDQRDLDRGVASAASRFLRSLRAVDALLIDGLGDVRPYGWTGERISTLIRRRYLNQRCLLVTTSMPISQQAAFSDRASGEGFSQAVARQAAPQWLGERIGKQTMRDLLDHCAVLAVPEAVFAAADPAKSPAKTSG